MIRWMMKICARFLPGRPCEQIIYADPPVSAQSFDALVMAEVEEIFASYGRTQAHDLSYPIETMRDRLRREALDEKAA